MTGDWGIYCRDTEGVKRQLGEAASEVMGRLSAASMESYSRAYPHLVRLHMLHEASDAAQLAARGSLGPIERQRVLRWDERLRITQSSLATQVRTFIWLQASLPTWSPSHAWMELSGSL